ncbi:BamA/TamA family outer membrane protein [Portibacter marinus]|uniref:BamA/TamA family outer membrane protein n=1 Tax=Portibacter marinus TaxID=2898660 RepID=UPI001F2CAA7A|nr:BamA/TamA family outer membrane protein [Portibacter marinus]
MNFKGLLINALIWSLLLLGNPLNAQNIIKRYFDNILNNKSDLSQPQLLVYPTLAYAPETSWEIGASTLYVYFAKRDTTNRLSEINAFSFVTLENQYGLWFDHALYSDKNRWFFLGQARIQSFPLFYHGIGIDTPTAYTARIEANQILIKERVLRRLFNDVYLGFEFDFQRLTGTDFILADPEIINFELPLGHEGSNSFGLGLGLIQDNRHNVLNVRKGLFSELAFLHYNSAWGSTFDFTSILSDTRVYKQMGHNNVLAFQLLGQFKFGEVPFNQLALMGGESMMRGYYYGRYRDKNQMAAQIEYRFLPVPFHFTDRLGFTLFTGAGSVFNQIEDLNISNFVVSGGAGLRFLLFPQKDIWTRLDFAVNAEGSGFYFFIGEAF